MLYRPLSLSFILILFAGTVLLQSCTIPERPVTKEEAMDLAHKIEKSVARHNSTLLGNIFDERGFARRVVSESDITLDKGLMEGAIEGLRKAQLLACFERLHAYMPGFSKGTIELIAAYTRAGDMDKAVQLVKQMRADKSLTPEKIQLLFNLHPTLQKAVEAAG